MGVLLVPEGEASGRVVLQVSSFIDSNDHWHYEDEAIEQAALRDLIRLLRSKDPEDALRILLADLRLEKYPTLRGKVFTLTVGTAPDRHGIDLVLS